jgi:hypothetical protein
LFDVSTLDGSTLMAASVGALDFVGAAHIRAFSSSDWAERGFCQERGTNLFYKMQPDKYIMAVGCFDEGETFVDSKPGFFDFAGDHERLTEEEFMASLNLPQTEKGSKCLNH